MREHAILANYPREWPTRTVESLDEYDGSDVVAIGCTQLGDPARQRRLVKEWCEFLPHAKNIRRVEFRSHTNQRLFDAACSMSWLERLEVKWGNIKDLTPIANLPNLEYLGFSSCPSAVGVSAIGRLSKLKYLELNHVRDAQNCVWIAELDCLIELDLGGSMWGRQVLDSLEPVSRLKNLQFLVCANCRVIDRSSLRSIGDMPNLREIRLDQSWPRRKDIEYLLVRKPELTVADWPW